MRFKTFQVEPNAHKIEEHRRKYERLRKEKELRKIELERQKRQVSPSYFRYCSI